VSEAAKQSLKKKGMHVPPWRRAEYVKAKWLSPYTRTASFKDQKKEEQQLLKEKIVTAEIETSGEENTAVIEWKPPELKPKGPLSGVKMVTGLAVVFDEDDNQ